jgi:hypothetical protein
MTEISEQKKEPRPWQTGKTIALSTTHLVLKEPRDYVFMEINQEYGSRLFWMYVIVILRQWPKVKDVIKKLRSELNDRKEDSDAQIDLIDSVISPVVQILPEVFPWESISEMSGILLCDHSVTVDGKKYVSGTDGMSGLSGDPIELFNALFFSMCVNWPKYFSPLLGGALNVSTQGSGPEQQSNEAVEG